MFVGDGVVGDDVGRCTLSQVLVGGIAGVKTVSAIGAEREACDRSVEGVGEHREVIDIAVVGGDGPGDGGVFQAGVGIGDGDWRVVGAGDNNRNYLSNRPTFPIINRHCEALSHRLTCSQVLRSTVGNRVSPAH